MSLIKNISGRKSIRNSDLQKLTFHSLNKDQLPINKTTENYFKDFLNHSSLHGLKYTADENLSFLERAFFTLSFILVIVLSGYFISNVYYKWKTTPIIIITDPKPTFTTKIPFPAVTICSMNQARRSKVANIKPGDGNYSLLMTLCERTDSNKTNAINYLFKTFDQFKSFALNVSIPCSEMIINCQFGGVEENCNDLFDMQLTDGGHCCNFNSVKLKSMLKNSKNADDIEYEEETTDNSTESMKPIDWTPEKGYPDKLPKYFYPRIARGTGRHKGLTIILNTSKSEYYCSSSQGYGFKVLVHNPTEIPKIKNFGFLVMPGKETRVIIKPILNSANDRIRSLPYDVRNCLFSDEYNLSYFKAYTRKNCESECEARMVHDKCKCILFYMPKIIADIEYCAPYQFPCALEQLTNIAAFDHKDSCEECLPACYELSYEYWSSSNIIIKGNFTTNEKYPKEYFESSRAIEDLSILTLYYGSNSFRAQIKEEIIGFTEFLSNVGGLLGLFMGFSVFSVIEIVYFLTLRPLYIFKTYQKNIKIEKKKQFGTFEKVLIGTQEPWYLNENHEFTLNHFNLILKHRKMNLEPKKKNGIIRRMLRKFKFTRNKVSYPYCE